MSEGMVFSEKLSDGSRRFWDHYSDRFARVFPADAEGTPILLVDGTRVVNRLRVDLPTYAAEVARTWCRTGEAG